MNINRETVLQSFREETDELLAQMEQSLLALESQPEDPELISSIFRAAHTLKGNASLLQFTAVTQALHSLEDLLDKLRSGTIRITSDIISLLLESVDVSRHLAQRMLAGEEAVLPEHQEFFSRLAHIANDSKSGMLPHRPTRSRRAPMRRHQVRPAEKSHRVSA